MTFKITLSLEAKGQLDKLYQNAAQEKRYKAIVKTLALMVTNLRHPSLNKHEYTILTKKYGKKIFESYAENHTSGAYRVFWFYGEDKKEITIIAITPHP